MTDHDEERARLSQIGLLLDEAVDLADAGGDTLLGAQIAQAVHCLETRLARLGPARRETVRGPGRSPGPR